MKRFKHAIKAFGLFIMLSGLFLWLIGVKLSGPAAKSIEKSAEQGEPEEADENEEIKDINVLVNEICEHKIKIIDCDKCRFEIGAVKVLPSVEKALISVSKAEGRGLNTILQATGVVELDQTGSSDILSPASGRVFQINAFLGQKVKAGDILAVLHSADFGEAKATYLKAYTNLEIARNEAERQTLINNTLEKFVNKAQDTNQEFSEKDAAIGSHKELIGEWKSKLGGAQARLQLAHSNFEREKNLWEKQISSKSDYDNASQELKVAEIEHTSILEEIQINIRTNKLRIDNEIKLAEAELKVAKQRLQIFGLDNNKILSLIHEKDDDAFTGFDLYAPKSGTIIAQNITEGKLIDPSQSLYTIANLENVWVWCDLYEKDLAVLQSAFSGGKTIEAKIKVSAFKNEIFYGKIDFIKSSIDEHTRTVKVRIQVLNENGKLKQGMFVDAEILIPSPRTGIVAPEGAVLSDEGKYFVFKHWKDDIWIRSDVELGEKQGDYLEIIKGLKKGEKIITGGAFMLKSDILREKMGAGCAD